MKSTKHSSEHVMEKKSKLTKKQSQWAWFIGLYAAGFTTIFMIAKLIKWAMGI